MARRSLPSYTLATATRRYRCTICLSSIEAGDKYHRRRRRYVGGQYITIYKCSSCLEIPGE